MNPKTSAIFLTIVSFLFHGCGSSGTEISDQVVDASCGMCRLGKPEQQGCLLNIRTKGQTFPVVGGPKMTMEEMHAPGGICLTIRQAKVSGSIDGDRFMASSFEFLPMREDAPSLPAAH